MKNVTLFRVLDNENRQIRLFLKRGTAEKYVKLKQFSSKINNPTGLKIEEGVAINEEDLNLIDVLDITSIITSTGRIETSIEKYKDVNIDCINVEKSSILSGKSILSYSITKKVPSNINDIEKFKNVLVEQCTDNLISIYEKYVEQQQLLNVFDLPKNVLKLKYKVLQTEAEVEESIYKLIGDEGDEELINSMRETCSTREEIELIKHLASNEEKELFKDFISLLDEYNKILDKLYIK